MDGMSMSPPSHEHAAPNSSAQHSPMSMEMSFYWGSHMVLLFSGWMPTTPKFYILSLIAVFFFAILHEWLAHLLRRSSSNFHDHHHLPEESESEALAMKNKRPWYSTGIAKLVIEVMIHAAYNASAYLLMLMVMSFNGGVFIVVIAGLTIGHFLFRQSLNKVVSPAMTDFVMQTVQVFALHQLRVVPSLGIQQSGFSGDGKHSRTRMFNVRATYSRPESATPFPSSNEQQSAMPSSLENSESAPMGSLPIRPPLSNPGMGSSGLSGSLGLNFPGSQIPGLPGSPRPKPGTPRPYDPTKQKSKVMEWLTPPKPPTELLQREHYKFSETCACTIYFGDLSKWTVDGQTDAVIAPANKKLNTGPAVNAVLFKAAGSKMLDTTQRLPDVAPQGIKAEMGDAISTRAFNLPVARVIHTVGSIFKKEQSGHRPSDTILEKAYKNALMVARKENLKHLAFPPLSCNIYGYPYSDGAEVALKVLKENCQGFERIDIVVRNIEGYEAFIDEANRVLEIVKEKKTVKVPTVAPRTVDPGLPPAAAAAASEVAEVGSPPATTEVPPAVTTQYQNAPTASSFQTAQQQNDAPQYDSPSKPWLNSPWKNQDIPEQRSASAVASITQPQAGSSSPSQAPSQFQNGVPLQQQDNEASLNQSSSKPWLNSPWKNQDIPEPRIASPATAVSVSPQSQTAPQFQNTVPPQQQANVAPQYESSSKPWLNSPWKNQDIPGSPEPPKNTSPAIAVPSGTIQNTPSQFQNTVPPQQQENEVSQSTSSSKPWLNSPWKNQDPPQSLSQNSTPQLQDQPPPLQEQKSQASKPWLNSPWKNQDSPPLSQISYQSAPPVQKSQKWETQSENQNTYQAQQTGQTTSWPNQTQQQIPAAPWSQKQSAVPWEGQTEKQNAASWGQPETRSIPSWERQTEKQSPAPWGNEKGAPVQWQKQTWETQNSVPWQTGKQSPAPLGTEKQTPASWERQPETQNAAWKNGNQTAAPWENTNEKQSAPSWERQPQAPVKQAWEKQPDKQITGPWETEKQSAPWGSPVKQSGASQWQSEAQNAAASWQAPPNQWQPEVQNVAASWQPVKQSQWQPDTQNSAWQAPGKQSGASQWQSEAQNAANSWQTPVKQSGATQWQSEAQHAATSWQAPVKQSGASQWQSEAQSAAAPWQAPVKQIGAAPLQSEAPVKQSPAAPWQPQQSSTTPWQPDAAIKQSASAPWKSDTPVRQSPAAPWQPEASAAAPWQPSTVTSWQPETKNASPWEKPATTSWEAEKQSAPSWEKQSEPPVKQNSAPWERQSEKPSAASWERQSEKQNNAPWETEKQSSSSWQRQPEIAPSQVTPWEKQPETQSSSWGKQNEMQTSATQSGSQLGKEPDKLEQQPNAWQQVNEERGEGQKASQSFPWEKSQKESTDGSEIPEETSSTSPQQQQGGYVRYTSSTPPVSRRY